MQPRFNWSAFGKASNNCARLALRLIGVSCRCRVRAPRNYIEPTFAPSLLDTLRSRELNKASNQLTAQTGLPRHGVAEGETVAGVYRQRLTLASGRFAMIDDGLGFSLVPWSPSLEKELGRQVSGAMTPRGVDWSFGQKKGIGL